MSLSHSDPEPRPRAAHIWPQEAAGKDGSADFLWLVFEHGHVGPPELRWLHRDPEQQS
jgi:hypothetical protein